MIVSNLIVFNGELQAVKGTVVAPVDDEYIVDFFHNGIEYRGRWKIKEVTGIEMKLIKWETLLNHE